MQTQEKTRPRTTSQPKPQPAKARSKGWWVLVGLVALLGLALVALESGMEGEPVPSFIWAPDGETTDAEREYAEAVGIPVESVQLDIAAVAELDRRGLDVCPTTDVPRLPGELAASAPVVCNGFDGHGGIGYGVITTIVAGIGALILVRRRNRTGLYLMLIVLLDMVGAVAGAYAIRALVVAPGSLPLGEIAAFIGGQAWIPMLVLLVPLLVLSVPTGRLLSPRWRLVMGGAAVSAGVLAITQALHPLLLGPILNPIAAPWSITTANSVFDSGNVLWMIVMAAALASLVVRAVRWGWRRVQMAR